MADPAEQTAVPLDGAERRGMKSASAFRTISEVATDLDVPQHVLRFWETKFSQIRPLKRGGGRRYYRPEDVELLRAIRALLYGDGYTIKGVQKLLRDGGLKPGRAPDAPPHGTVGAPRIVEAPKPAGHGPAAAAPQGQASIAVAAKAVSASGLDHDTKLALKSLLEELSGLRALLRK
ncbi:MAG: MerR family transcriptional regulator [Alphaproteobacteria bacterium]